MISYSNNTLAAPIKKNKKAKNNVLYKKKVLRKYRINKVIFETCKNYANFFCILYLLEQQEYSLNKISFIFGYNLLYKQPFSNLWNTEKIENIKLHVYNEKQMMEVSRSKLLISNYQFSTSKFIFSIDLWFDIPNPYCFKTLKYSHCQSCFYTARSVLLLALTWICAQKA